ncbi:unnamed protein product [Thelazia callipaeda]|uniref:Ovule protein n=1 Tax=Thelazia callipaeda TaxID=103827 RepID=A0A0N5CWZ3_THECL|nr:unnamed protein product [Thelazia callipaeda]
MLNGWGIKLISNDLVSGNFQMDGNIQNGGEHTRITWKNNMNRFPRRLPAIPSLNSKLVQQNSKSSVETLRSANYSVCDDFYGSTLSMINVEDHNSKEISDEWQHPCATTDGSQISLLSSLRRPLSIDDDQGKLGKYHSLSIF